MNGVPLARRNLMADRRRLIASVAGVGLALMLIALLDGLWTGLQAQVSVYTDGTCADLYVAQPGTRNLLGDTSMIPVSIVDAVRAERGVDRASPVRGLYVILRRHGRTIPVYLVGSAPGGLGGPWALEAGRRARASGEIVVDAVTARRHGLRLGGSLEVMDRRFTIVGLSSGTSGFMTGFVFVTHEASDLLIRAPGTTSYVLVSTREPAAVRTRLDARGFNVLTASQIARADRELFMRVFGVPVRLMVGVAFAAGTLIVALTAYTSVVERRREYGIAKAMGARTPFLVRTAAAHTMLLSAFGLAAGAALFAGGRALIGWWRPQFSVLLTAGAAVRTLAAAAAMGLLAATVPARRLARIEPASVYRSAS